MEHTKSNKCRTDWKQTAVESGVSVKEMRLEVRPDFAFCPPKMWGETDRLRGAVEM